MSAFRTVLMPAHKLLHELS